MSNDTAFRIYPIIDQYGMETMIAFAEEAFEATITAAIRAGEAASMAKEAARLADDASKADAEAASEAASEAATAAHDLSPRALWPSAPIASSQVHKHPGLIQWLALASQLHRNSLVGTCLSHLFRLPDGTIQGVLASPHLRGLMRKLDSETMFNIMCKQAGLPLGFEVVTTDCLY